MLINHRLDMLDKTTEKIGKSIYIATPAYDGKLWADYVFSLMDTCDQLRAAGYSAQYRVLPGDPLIHSARNRICYGFLGSKSDWLLMVDSDIAWEAGKVAKMLESGKEAIYGLVPCRQNLKVKYTVAAERAPDEKGLVKVEAAGAGFLLLHRTALQKVIDAGLAKTIHGGGHAFFESPYIDGMLAGEDMLFCRKLKLAGVELFGYADINFQHLCTAQKAGNYMEDECVSSLTPEENEKMEAMEE